MTPLGVLMGYVALALGLLVVSPLILVIAVGAADSIQGGGPMSEKNGQKVQRWREYQIMVPAEVASILDKALDEQAVMENRAIDNSEFFCWLLGLGLTARDALKKQDEKNNRRIIQPGE